jgi:hypothetical protein
MRSSACEIFLLGGQSALAHVHQGIHSLGRVLKTNALLLHAWMQEEWGVEQCGLICPHPPVLHRAGIVWLWDNGVFQKCKIGDGAFRTAESCALQW